MEFDEDLASIHAYLCADGYVIKNPPTQRHKYYYIGLRNTNIVLLRDFQRRFLRHFGIKPIIVVGQRAKIQNKRIYYQITKNQTYYSNCWTFPELNKKLLRYWLRAYFDCDGWVSVVRAKDRKVGLESINRAGILKIKNAQGKFGIVSTLNKRKNRRIWSLSICGRDDLTKFAKNIGFLHPKKSAKLNEALNSYVNYVWKMPTDKTGLLTFIKTKGNESKARGQIRFNSIRRKNLSELKRELSVFGIKSRLSKSLINGNGNKYYTLSIKKRDFQEGSEWISIESSESLNSRK